MGPDNITPTERHTPFSISADIVSHRAGHYKEEADRGSIVPCARH